MKVASATAAALAMVVPIEAQERPSVAPKNMQAIAPALAGYTDRVLFGDVWVRPELAPRDRSIVTLSALVATGKTAQMTSHLNRGLDNGIKPSEVAGIVTQLAFYTGWPNAVSAFNEVEKVFAARHVDLTPLAVVPPATAPLPGSDPRACRDRQQDARSDRTQARAAYQRRRVRRLVATHRFAAPRP